ncbi:MAG: cation:proton antiporter [Gammaproteobacteria bacterium]|nr:cation:proton antiporter [Gammaproteobacteria bacterium]
MHIDPFLPTLVGIILSILLLGVLLKWIHQPEIIGYLLAGVVVGPHGVGFVDDPASVNHMGTLGVTLLLFFIGMEVSPRKLVLGWRIAVIGTLLQVFVSVALVWVIGSLFDWSLARILLLGFVISLSSTAVVLKLLKDRGELDTPVGNDVLLILLAQDMAVVPMLIVLGFLGGSVPTGGTLTLQLIGAVLLIGLGAWLASRESIRLPFSERLREDHELQVFAALLACFGMAFITAMLELSTALGAFVGGMLVATARETEWVQHSLESFRTLFVAIFFVSVGLMVDLDFILSHWMQIALLVLAVLITNTLVNAAVLRALRVSWRRSLLTGAILAQIGEFSFILAAAGRQAGIITDYAYQSTIATISISLVLSAPWIALARRWFEVASERERKPT